MKVGLFFSTIIYHTTRSLFTLSWMSMPLSSSYVKKKKVITFPPTYNNFPTLTNKLVLNFQSKPSLARFSKKGCSFHTQELEYEKVHQMWQQELISLPKVD